MYTLYCQLVFISMQTCPHSILLFLCRANLPEDTVENTIQPIYSAQTEKQLYIAQCIMYKLKVHTYTVCTNIIINIWLVQTVYHPIIYYVCTYICVYITFC